MNRKQFRQSVVELLYLMSMDGEHQEGSFSAEAIEVASEVLFNVYQIDEVISNNLVNWTIDRLNYVDKAIIRYAVYEMLFTDTPVEIIINEAIELTKHYTNLDDDQARGFNNRLLDNIAKSLEKE